MRMTGLKRMFCGTGALLTALVCLFSMCAFRQPVRYKDGFQGAIQTIPANYIRYYDTKTDAPAAIEIGFPNFPAANDTDENACAPVAGTHLLSFWDAYYGNLIPDYTARTYVPIFKKEVWKSSNDAKLTATRQTLYGLMKTTSAGTAEADFKSGLQNYVNGKGYSVSFSSVRNDSGINLTALKQAFAAHTPVVLFLSPKYNECSVSSYSDRDEFTRNNYVGAHVMVAYGMHEFTYVTNGVASVETFLDVATGKKDNTLNLIRLEDEYCSIEDAVAVKIYS